MDLARVGPGEDGEGHGHLVVVMVVMVLLEVTAHLEEQFLIKY